MCSIHTDHENDSIWTASRQLSLSLYVHDSPKEYQVWLLILFCLIYRLCWQHLINIHTSLSWDLTKLRIVYLSFHTCHVCPIYISQMSPVAYNIPDLWPMLMTDLHVLWCHPVLYSNMSYDVFFWPQFEGHFLFVESSLPHYQNM